MPPAVPAPALAGPVAADGSRDGTPAVGRREQRRARTRARIIETAMRLALEGGYEAVQMREVAERAEVSLATIYRHFPGKDVVLVAGLGEWVRLVRKRIER
ncbi:MAG: TetR/AcrR family transcriptional regulator, partial [Actinomyces sp.]